MFTARPASRVVGSTRGAVMSRLQPCPKCGAQFDVSAMAAGTAFTCGACGAVVTAGAAATPSRLPPAPAHAGVGTSGAHRSAASGTSSVRSSSTRGPQYVPVDRHREHGAAGRRGDDEDAGRHGRGEHGEHGRRGERGERLAPPKKGLSPLALGAISLGGIAIVIVVLVLAASSKNKDKNKPTESGGTPVAQNS